MSQYLQEKSPFNEAEGLEACKFIKKRLQRRCFPINIAIFLRAAFFQNTSGGCYAVNFENI